MAARAEIKGRRWIRRVGWALLALVVLLVVAGASVGEVRNLALYTLAPRYARDANFVHFAKNETDVFILGTIHGKHFSTSAYSLAHLKAIIARMKPSLLLVEARPEEIARQRWGDGPIEMPFAALYARQRGIPVDGIDWWTLSDRLRRTDDSRDNRIYRHLRAKLPARGSVLVLIGFSHVPELATRLKSDGFVERTIPAPRKKRIFELLDEPFVYPRGMAQAIRQRITDAEARAASSPEGIAQQLRAVAVARRAYLTTIERVGETGPASAPTRRK